MNNLQTAAELDDFYQVEDPWAYKDTADDTRRLTELLAVMPKRQFERVLDIGCGNGFVTLELPGNFVHGVDLSAKAVGWSEARRLCRSDSRRFCFTQSSLFDLDTHDLGCFDLIVITGVLYQQYIGKSFSLVRRIIDSLLQPGGNLVSCHIDDWNPPLLPYTLLDRTFYPYREYIHRLEVYVK